MEMGNVYMDLQLFLEHMHPMQICQASHYDMMEFRFTFPKQQLLNHLKNDRHRRSNLLSFQICLSFHLRNYLQSDQHLQELEGP